MNNFEFITKCIKEWKKSKLQFTGFMIAIVLILRLHNVKLEVNLEIIFLLYMVFSTVFIVYLKRVDLIKTFFHIFIWLGYMYFCLNHDFNNIFYFGCSLMIAIIFEFLLEYTKKDIYEFINICFANYVKNSINVLNFCKTIFKYFVASMIVISAFVYDFDVYKGSIIIKDNSSQLLEPLYIFLQSEEIKGFYDIIMRLAGLYITISMAIIGIFKTKRKGVEIKLLYEWKYSRLQYYVHFLLPLILWPITYVSYELKFICILFILFIYYVYVNFTFFFFIIRIHDIRYFRKILLDRLVYEANNLNKLLESQQTELGFIKRKNSSKKKRLKISFNILKFEGIKKGKLDKYEINEHILDLPLIKILNEKDMSIQERTDYICDLLYFGFDKHLLSGSGIYFTIVLLLDSISKLTELSWMEMSDMIYQIFEIIFYNKNDTVKKMYLDHKENDHLQQCDERDMIIQCFLVGTELIAYKMDIEVDELMKFIYKIYNLIKPYDNLFYKNLVYSVYILKNFQYSTEMFDWIIKVFLLLSEKYKLICSDLFYILSDEKDAFLPYKDAALRNYNFWYCLAFNQNVILENKIDKILKAKQNFYIKEILFM